MATVGPQKNFLSIVAYKYMLGNIQMKKNGLVKPIQLLKVENGLHFGVIQVISHVDLNMAMQPPMLGLQ